MLKRFVKRPLKIIRKRLRKQYERLFPPAPAQTSAPPPPRIAGCDSALSTEAAHRILRYEPPQRIAQELRVDEAALVAFKSAYLVHRRAHLVERLKSASDPLGVQRMLDVVDRLLAGETQPPRPPVRENSGPCLAGCSQAFSARVGLRILRRDPLRRIAQELNLEEAALRNFKTEYLTYRRQELAQRLRSDQNPHVVNRMLNNVEELLGCDRLLSYPLQVSIWMANMCNAECVFCGYRHKEGVPLRYLTPYHFERMTWIKYITTLVLFSGSSDSLLNPHFAEIFRLMRERYPHVYTHLQTNGIRLKDEICDVMIGHPGNLYVSIHAATAETWGKTFQVPPGRYPFILSQIKKITAFKKERGTEYPKLILGFVITDLNVHEIARFAELAVELGANKVVYTHAITGHLSTEAKRPLIIQNLAEHYDAQMQYAADYLHRHGVEVTRPAISAEIENTRKAGDGPAASAVAAPRAATVRSPQTATAKPAAPKRAPPPQKALPAKAMAPVKPGPAAAARQGAEVVSTKREPPPPTPNAPPSPVQRKESTPAEAQHRTNVAASDRPLARAGSIAAKNVIARAPARAPRERAAGAKIAVAEDSRRPVAANDVRSDQMVAEELPIPAGDEFDTMQMISEDAEELATTFRKPASDAPQNGNRYVIVKGLRRPVPEGYAGGTIYNGCKDPYRIFGLNSANLARSCCKGAVFGFYSMEDLDETGFDKIWNCDTALMFRRTVNVPGGNSICDRCQSKALYDVEVSEEHMRDRAVFMSGLRQAEIARLGGLAQFKGRYPGYNTSTSAELDIV